MPALTVYGLSTAAASLPTATQLSSSGGGASTTTKTTLVGTATGFGRIASQGATTAWPALTSLQSPAGMGFLWDVTTLENQQILPGSWTPSVTLATSVGSVVADIYVRVFLWNAGIFIPASSSQGPNYAVLTGQAITTTPTTFALPATTLPQMTFLTGWKLYFDIWLNITTNSTGSGSATIALTESSTANGVTSLQLLTPGYQALSQSQLTNLRTFGGFPLHDGVNYLLQEKSFDFPPLAETYFPIARGGTKMTGFRVNQKSIPVSLTVVGWNRADVESKLDALSLALSNKQQNLVLHALDGRYWVADAITAPVQFSPGRLLWVSVDITFVATQPYAYAASASTLVTSAAPTFVAGTVWQQSGIQLVRGGTFQALPTVVVTNTTASNNTTLTTGLTSGTAYTSLTVAALPNAALSGDTYLLNDGAGHTQSVVLSAPALAGATTLSVVSFTANFSYPGSGATTVQRSTAFNALSIQNTTEGSVITFSSITLTNVQAFTLVCDPAAANGYTGTIAGGSPLNFTGNFPTLDVPLSSWTIQVSCPSQPTFTTAFTWTPRWLL